MTLAQALVEAFSGGSGGPRIFVSQLGIDAKSGTAQLVWPTGRVDLTLSRRRLTCSVSGKLRRKSLALSRLRGAAAMLSVPLVEVAS